MDYNYHLIYEMRPHQDAIFAAKRAVEEAKNKLIAAEKSYIKLLETKTDSTPGSLSTDHHTCCMANGIAYHAYKNKKCVYCGSIDDDYDF